MSDWIEWNGGECPVGKGAKVDVRFGNGEQLDDINGPETWSWSSRLPDHVRIVAYRLHQEGHYEEQPDGTITPVDPVDMAQPEVTGEWVMVPREPTPEMIAHANTAAVAVNVFVVGQFKSAEAQERVLMAAVYKAMLAAAPSAASAIEAAVNAKLEEAAKAIEEEISWSDAADDQDELANRVLEQAAAKVRALIEPKS